MYTADRSVIVTLKQAREMASQFQAETVGVLIDVFHVWHDPDLYQEIEKTPRTNFWAPRFGLAGSASRPAVRAYHDGRWRD